jgi:hypothetical protein
MTDLLKSWAKNGFSIEINTTKCGTHAYRVYDGDQEIFHNNNFYPSKKAKSELDSDLIVFELIKTLVEQTKRLDDYQFAYLPDKKRSWIKSNRFLDFINQLPTDSK